MKRIHQETELTKKIGQGKAPNASGIDFGDDAIRKALREERDDNNPRAVRTRDVASVGLSQVVDAADVAEKLANPTDTEATFLTQEENLAKLAALRAKHPILNGTAEPSDGYNGATAAFAREHGMPFHSPTDPLVNIYGKGKQS